MEADQHPAQTLAERRQHPRHQLKLMVHYQVTGQPNGRSFATSITTQDLGIGGMALRVLEKLEMGQTLSVSLKLPKPEAVGSGQREDTLPVEKQVTLTAHVVWRWPNDGSQYLVGIQFQDLEQSSAKILKQFLEDYSLQDSNVKEADRSTLLSRYDTSVE